MAERSLRPALLRAAHGLLFSAGKYICFNVFRYPDKGGSPTLLRR